jgi:hypothetical protein
MIVKVILYYKILEKLGESYLPAGRDRLVCQSPIKKREVSDDR